jgi:hypothetical protein
MSERLRGVYLTLGWIGFFFGRIECLFHLLLTFFKEGIRLQVMEAFLARAHLARSAFITGIDD